MKRSPFSLAIDFRSIDARVNCDGFVLHDGHAFYITVNTPDSFCTVLPVEVSNFL